MASTKNIKLSFLSVFILTLVGWLVFGTLSSAVSPAPAAAEETQGIALGAVQDDYVGSETCRGCHESQFDKVAMTKHGKLGDLASWKGKVVGCESCHGPGKAHVEGGGDKTKIKILANLDPKAVSETCLACHAGKENHNNFRRGDHWRNNVGCTDCHSAHGTSFAPQRAGSIVQIGPAAAQRSNQADRAMLKNSEPQLCMTCHTEVKAQFSKPFRHKVLEGTMNCSDCHNPHGGFEQKQTKLAVGADASCIKCHSQMQGPFVFEHAPLQLEGCSACHTPHGSSNAKMLKRSTVRQLCLECHTNIFNVELDPNLPAGPHTQTSIRTQNCTVCHSQIHGSHSSRFFFR
ncbi:MAG: DmsE family decaheme c-type cytochrome [bacterium]|nr:DmsE family decaheme c-type cytochrome [bacterium]